MKNYEEVKAELENMKTKSAWDRGVKDFAIDLFNEFVNNKQYRTKEPETRKELETELLNGARDWKEFSYGGCWLIYDGDIAEALCNPSELKKTRNGERNPNSRETWLDVQARALYQACRRIKNIMF